MALWGKKSGAGKKVGAETGPDAPANASGTTVLPSPELSAVEARARAGASKRQLMSLGEIVSVLMRSPEFRTLALAEVAALVVPAVRTGQFLVAEAQSKVNGFVTPVAMALWATVSEGVDRRLSDNLDQPFRLAANEWKSGQIAWLIALVGDRRGINPLLNQLQKTTLKGRPIKMRAKGKDGKTVVGTFAANKSPLTPAMS